MTNRVTVNDVRAAGYCAKGIRRWFDQRCAVDPSYMTFSQFCQRGMPIEEFEAIGEAYTEHVLRLMRERSNG